MFVVALIVLNTTGFFKPDGMVGIGIFSPPMLAIVAFGFVVGFYLVFRKSRLKTATRP